MNTQLLHYYARRAQEYEQIYAKPERQADLDRVRSWLRDELRGHRVLEVACGTGYWTAWLAPVTAHLVATDASAEVLEVARNKPYPPERVRFVIADAYDLGAVSSDFSAAFAGFFWSHVPRESIPAFLRSVHGRLRPGSRVVLLDNRFVEASSSPIARRDASGNTSQRRRLADGTEHEVVKNFPGPLELRADLGSVASGLHVLEFEHYWGASYETRELARGRLMKGEKRLRRTMTSRQFEHGYWYAAELKGFAQSIGIPDAGALRKDELERAIKQFLRSGAIENAARRPRSRPGVRDVERGLRLQLPVKVYTNDRQTKEFLEREAARIDPDYRRRPGARYRLNRWREDRLGKGVKLTYGGLVREYVRLSQTKEPFERIPHGRYINFMSDFLASVDGATRRQAIQAWKKLKRLDAPKDFRSWVRWKSSRSK